MTKEQVKTAIQEGIPFQIKMADGEKYDVTDRFSVALGPISVVVVDEDGVAHVLPLLTMTGISYRKKRK